MSGLYIHIPFCKEACSYCDFHFSIALGRKSAMVDCLCRELEERKEFFTGEILQSIYFGGGTPSLLTREELNKLMNTIQGTYRVSKETEFTLEANPDDLSYDMCQFLRDAGFNRLSIGIQSWHSEDLRMMNRKHSVDDGMSAVSSARKAGIENISIDLIYGLPGMDEKQWKENLEKTFALPITHLSAYHLTYEPGTKMYHSEKKGRIKALHEEESIAQYYLLLDEAGRQGFEQYELSNFCRPGYASRHNSAYWSGAVYLGIGPSAHSYDGKSRSWNIASIRRYMEGIQSGKREFEWEELSEDDRYNEYIMTSLRTVKGCDPEYISRHFGAEAAAHFMQQAESYLNRALAMRKEGYIALTREGMVVSDHIISALMRVGKWKGGKVVG